MVQTCRSKQQAGDLISRTHGGGAFPGARGGRGRVGDAPMKRKVKDTILLEVKKSIYYVCMPNNVFLRAAKRALRYNSNSLGPGWILFAK